MAYDFPANPTEDQEYKPPIGGQTYVYKAPRWLVRGVPPSGGEIPPGIDEAPVDGKQYGRQDTAWTEVPPNPDWAALAGKPATFPPELPIPSSGVTGLDAAQTAQDNAIATKLDNAAYTGPDILAKIKNVDGTGSGLDADVLDGYESSYYLDYNNFTNKPATFPPTVPIAWTDISDKPPTYPPTLPIAQSGVTNLTGDLAAKEPIITAGTIAQYWRGDKTWQPLPPPGVLEAPVDGNPYVRKNAGWVADTGALPSGVAISDVAPLTPMIGQLWFESDTGNTYIWYDDGDTRQWIHVSGFSAYSFGAGGGIAEAPADGKLYARSNTAWLQIGTSGGVPEAPVDGKQYVRKDGSWVEYVPTVTPFMFDVNGDAIVKFGSTIVVRIKSTGLIMTKDDVEVFSVSV